MEIFIGVVLYLIVLKGFSMFGNFLKQCDEEIKEMKH